MVNFKKFILPWLAAAVGLTYAVEDTNEESTKPKCQFIQNSSGLSSINCKYFFFF